tara:strand:+ start:1361 stop:1627 length:267 start_codon:yes stop_codon:yes gene_type:complete
MINDKYETRVSELEAEGMTRSDAQAIVDMHDMTQRYRPNVTIKTVSTNEPNVSNRTITYDIYVDGIPAVGNIADVLEAIELKNQYEAN